MSTPAEKDVSVESLLARLRERLGADAFLAVDHWPTDPFAIGIARPDNLEVLAYISTAGADPEDFFVSLELPPAGGWSDFPYSPAGDRTARGFDELVAALRQHLSVTVT